MSNRFEILVEGIDDDPTLVAEVEKTIQASFRDMGLPGAWRVVVRPSRVGGRWDISVHGTDVRHVLSIAVPAILLPTLIPVRLQESLQRLSAARLRPVRRVASPVSRSIVHGHLSASTSH